MESLSGNQIQELKELYIGIYNQTIDETTGNLQKLDKQQRDAMKGKFETITLPDGSTRRVYEGNPEYDRAVKNKKVNNNKEIKKNSVEIGANKVKQGAPIIINLPNGGTKKIYPASDEYEKIKSGEQTTIKTTGEGETDYNIKPVAGKDGTYVGSAYQTTSGLGVTTPIVKDNKIDKSNVVKNNDNDNKVKKEKPLLSTKLPSTTELGSKVREIKPGSNRDKMIAKNELKFGSDHVSNLRNMDADFKRMRSGEITKMDFMKQYPNSQTTKKYNQKQIKLGKPIIKSHYEPYDLVLDYILSEGHAETVEEAHYVMTQMDAETIQTIVEEKKKLNEFLGGRPNDGYYGHPNLNIENPFAKKKIKTTVTDKSDAKKLPDVNINKVGATIGDRNMKLKKMIDDI